MRFLRFPGWRFSPTSSRAPSWRASSPGSASRCSPTRSGRSSPLPVWAQGLIPADFGKDHDVDADDFGIFQRCYSGAGKPADPNCAN
jgi:hypothetical protein